MTDAIEPLTAKVKLATSRAALLGAMGYEQIKTVVDGEIELAALPPPASRNAMSAISEKIGHSALGRWWRRSPLSSVVQIGQPLLEEYAYRNPGKLIAYGAGAGAALWIVKPWKLLSVATVVTLVFRNMDVSAIISDLLRKAGASESTTRSPRV